MRILQVRFKNLNSLAGEWQIDLSHPSYAADGIFAITGPTGAGKTTILDAICLALYGSTPRLQKVTKGGNEIMSRQTGECFAEVTFATQAGRYRCHWSQHRARRKAGGDLQAQRHELVDADSGQVIEAQVRRVAERIEAATGMDFDRFTRSMLLAQGSFAAFLQAPPDQRAPILEQITGTAIYSQISIRVHERRAAERQQMDTLRTELAGLTPLGEDDERLLRAAFAQKMEQDRAYQRQIEQHRLAIAWLDGIARLERELRQVEEQQQVLEGRCQAFAPERETLDRATRALGLAGDYAALKALRAAQQQDRNEQDRALLALPGREEAARLAAAALAAATTEWESGKAARDQAAPAIRKARELDLQLAAMAARMAESTVVLRDAEQSLATLRTQQHDDGVKLGTQQAAFDALLAQIERSRIDQALVEQLAGIAQQMDTVTDLFARRHKAQAATAQAGVRVTQAERQRQRSAEILRERQAELERARRALAQQQRELTQVLDGRALADWRDDLSLLTDQQAQLSRLGDAAESRATARQALAESRARHGPLSTEQARVTEQLAHQQRHRGALEKEQELLQTQLALLKRIEGFERARDQLRDGDSCPLCGAVEHPFAEGNVPVPDETRQHLAQAHAAASAAADAVAALSVKQTGLGKDLERLVADRQRYEQQCAEADSLINEIGAAFAIGADSTELAQRLRCLGRERTEQIERARGILHAAERLEQDVAELRAAVERSRDAAVVAERASQAAAHGSDAALAQRDGLTKDQGELDARCEQALDTLRRGIGVYGLVDVDVEVEVERLDGMLSQLRERRAQWLQRQQASAEGERAIAALRQHRHHRAAQIDQAEQANAAEGKRCERLRAERETLCLQRRELFGEAKPDAEEARHAAACETAEQALEAARRREASATRELAQLQATLDRLSRALSERAVQLAAAAQVYQQRLVDAAFDDEAAYLAACLPEAQRVALARRAQELADSSTALAASAREKSTQLTQQRGERVSGQTRDQLDQSLREQATAHRALQQEIGAVRKQLKDNETLLEAQRSRLAAIDAQQRECARWDRLHQLIGSNDGKKYRNFAQGLTFELMIGHANRQLRKMTDRYLLTHSPTAPLELNVIDNYQAGEMRSTKNLSGGEGFIVSLALALGLSQMASRTVRVDSLFLDEGFGTLDEEALDTALQTLSSLQQDGKLIGVISHVPTLKERIGTQIQVIPTSGGRSVIAGPGCQRKG